MSVAVLVIVPGVAQSMIQSGRKAPPAEKIVETCLPSIKREKMEAVALCEYVPIEQTSTAPLLAKEGARIGSICGIGM